MMRQTMGVLLASVMLCATLCPPLVAAKTTRNLTIELSSPRGAQRQTMALSESTIHEIHAIIDEVDHQVGVATSIREQYQAYASAVARLYPYGLFGSLSLAQAQRLVTFWYRGGIPGHPLQATSTSTDKNLFCLVSGHTDVTYTSRPLPYALMFLGAGIILFSFLFAHPYPGPISSLIAVFGYLFVALGESLAYRVQVNPIAIADFVDIGLFNWQQDKYLYSSGEVVSLGLLGSKGWQGEMRGSLPPYKLRIQDVWDACPAMYEFSGIKVWLNDDGSEQSYLGSALAVGLVEKS